MSEQKGYCEDLTEGKFSFPVSHAMWTDNARKGEILRILRSKTTENTVKSYVVQCLDKSGSLEYTRAALEDLHERAKILLAEIPQQNTAAEALFDKLILEARSVV
jgi:geranylgeranyl diphosphate synthase type 3